MVDGVAGGGEDAEAGAGVFAFARQDHLGAEPVGAGGVVGVRVGEEDDADPAALGGRGEDRLEVAVVVGARVDHRAGALAVEVGVGPFQRHRPRVGGEDA